MGSVGVVEPLVLAQGVEQVLLVPDQRSVEEFAAATADPALHDGVHPRDADSAEDDLNAGVGEHGVEQRRELSVPVTDQEPCGAARVFEVHDEVPGGLGDQGCGRVCGGAEDADPAAGVFDDREHVQAGAAQRAGLEVVAGQ